MRPERPKDSRKSTRGVRGPPCTGRGGPGPRCSSPDSGLPRDPRGSGAAGSLSSLRPGTKAGAGGATACEGGEGALVCGVPALSWLSCRAPHTHQLCEPPHDPISRPSGRRAERLSNLSYTTRLVSGRMGLPIPWMVCQVPEAFPSFFPQTRCPTRETSLPAQMGRAAAVFVSFLPQWVCSPSRRWRSCHPAH